MANLKGAGDLRKLLKNLKKNGDKAVQKGIDRVATLIETDAKANVPVRKGVLKASIKTEHIELGAKVGSDRWEAPFQEFGTGPHVDIPKGQEEYARTFFINGLGNTRPAPFLFPALFKNQDKIVPFIEEELDKALKGIK